MNGKCWHKGSKSHVEIKVYNVIGQGGQQGARQIIL